MHKLKHIHPFPARMAPEIAFRECRKLATNSVVLDPMCGSGTTLRMALKSGLKAFGSDLDPLSVLVSTVTTTPLDKGDALRAASDVIEKARKLRIKDTRLPWVDNDPETKEFINFWFAQRQKNDLRKIVTVINKHYKGPIASFLKVTVSRLIITKGKAASLALDTSHSRPHRSGSDNDFEVFPNFIKSARQILERLPEKALYTAEVRRADARKLTHIEDASIDAVITSPPYLNAIDYMRGHKLSLVWLGYKIRDLRQVRGTSIGAERKPSDLSGAELIQTMTENMDFYKELKGRDRGMFDRYTLDMLALMYEIERVLKPGGKAILVVGNSCLKNVFIKNTLAVQESSKIAGLEFVKERKRDLPANMRYLPINANASSLANRMRTESILSFTKPASQY